ncbi:hypothetical protein [Streptomyces qinglanensis]|uniref:hypothetical protein n=1 Tax=Streptomyces qinglanensis TaxID=943816 RepID=UPI003D71AB8D
MTDDQQQRAITPTRVIPSSDSTPRTGPPPAPPLPPAPAGTDPASLPPWRRPAPAPAPPAAPPPRPPENWHSFPGQQPAPGPIEVYVTLVPVPAEQEDEPGIWARAWTWLTDRIKPWKAAIATAAAVAPMWPLSPYSAATTWAYTMGEARDMHLATGYALAFGTFGVAALRLVRSRNPGMRVLFATVVTFVGLFGAVDWYDPISWLTGVYR